MISERRRGWLHAVFPKSIGERPPNATAQNQRGLSESATTSRARQVFRPTDQGRRRFSLSSLFAPDNQPRRNQSDGGCGGHPEVRHGLIAACFNQRFADSWGKSAE